MDQPTRSGIMDALENIAAELERLRVLKEHELSVHIKKEAPGGSGPYVEAAKLDADDE
jgi:hypothetical protein